MVVKLVGRTFCYRPSSSVAGLFYNIFISIWVLRLAVAEVAASYREFGVRWRRLRGYELNS